MRLESSSTLKLSREENFHGYVFRKRTVPLQKAMSGLEHPDLIAGESNLAAVTRDWVQKIFKLSNLNNLNEMSRLLRWFYSLRRDCKPPEPTPIIGILWFRILRQVAGGRWKGNLCVEPFGELWGKGKTPGLCESTCNSH